MLDLLLSEISSAPLLLRDSAIGETIVLGKKILKEDKIEPKSLPKLQMAGYISPENEYNTNPFDDFQEGTIAVLPIIGTMYKYGGWYSHGMDNIADLLRLADKSSKITGVILYMNTPGGTTKSVIQMEDALRNRTKPCVAFIDGESCSAGIYVASFCDHIIAVNPMCQVGSVGVQLKMLDFSAWYESMGIKSVTVRPPESKFKNTEFEEALNGNEDRLVKEILSPYAVHFQNLIKTNRPQVDTYVEGLLEGKVFYAQDAINYGLIDSIGNFDFATSKVQELASSQKDIYSIFKN